VCKDMELVKQTLATRPTGHTWRSLWIDYKEKQESKHKVRLEGSVNPLTHNRTPKPWSAHPVFCVFGGGRAANAVRKTTIPACRLGRSQWTGQSEALHEIRNVLVFTQALQLQTLSAGASDRTIRGMRSRPPITASGFHVGGLLSTTGLGAVQAAGVAAGGTNRHEQDDPGGGPSPHGSPWGGARHVSLHYLRSARCLFWCSPPLLSLPPSFPFSSVPPVERAFAMGPLVCGPSVFGFGAAIAPAGAQFHGGPTPRATVSG
jgi:hypothetical protein